MRFTSLLAFVLTSTAGLAAAATVHSTAVSDAVEFKEAIEFVGEHAGNATLAKRSGCGSSGPLGTGHFVWYIVVGCRAGAAMTCQATDASGCVPGNTRNIGSMEVNDPNATIQYAKRSNTNTLPFVCPSQGQVRCQANFNNNNDGPNYSLRVF